MSAPDPARCPHCFGATRVTPCPHCGWQPGQDNPPPALTLGRILDGRYRIGRVLGHGGFGITYLAWDDNLHLRLAIKEYLPRDSATRAPDGVSLAIFSGPAGEQFAYGLDRFLEEARALAHFDQHPGIVTVKNFFRAYGTGYCVMDYVDGITLRHYLDQQPGGRIGVADALKLLMPVMDALRAVHKEGLLHRDLAPDNIYLTADGRIKLLDFGAARFAASEHSKSLSIILKPGYAPEEQYRSKGKQGPWTDVYGLAATFYRAITGTVPPEALDRTEEDELLPPSKQGIAIPPHQEAVLLKALAIKAPSRYQSISEFQQAWRTAALPVSNPLADAGAVESTPAPVIPAPEAANGGKSGLILVFIGVMILMAVTGIGLWAERPEPAPPMVAATPPKPAQTDPAPAEPIMAPPAPMVTLSPVAPDTPTSPMTTVAPAVPAAPSDPAAPASATAPAVGGEAGEPAIPKPPAKPGGKSPIYFAAEVAPTANAPSEAPLCYKFMVDGPEEQLRKLKTKYPNLYDDQILTNKDGSKTLQAKRQDETGKVITYFYSTSPSACNSYQKNRLDSQQPSGIAEDPGASSTLRGSMEATTSASHNDRYRFLGRNQEIVEDFRTNLQWQRCSLGQIWNGATCVGEATKYKWDEARLAAPAGWRLPTKDELASLIYCSSGEPAYWKPTPGLCKGAYVKPTLWSAVFANTPASLFWSSSPYASSSSHAWGVSFSNGYVGDDSKSDSCYVRFVRDPLRGSKEATTNASQNERYQFLGRDQEIVEDTRTKLQWQRCTLGQTWNGATCVGEATKYEWWDEARLTASAGWRLPTKDELSSLVYCGSGEPANWKPSSEWCKGAYEKKPTIWSAAFPNTPAGLFWSSSPYAGGYDGAWSVNFFGGSVYGGGKWGGYYVRLVRGGQ